MKTNKYHIIRAWILLLCFFAGQYVVYTHQHNTAASVKIAAHPYKSVPSHPVITENCQLCDAMHHNAMAIISLAYFAPVVVTGYSYKTTHYAFTSMALILSAGRSPPALLS